MDLSKLSPAPWTADGPKANNGLYDVRTEYRGGFATFPAPNLDRTNAEFIALARNAFDIMLRRGWYAKPESPFCPGEGWRVQFKDPTQAKKGWSEFNAHCRKHGIVFSDPFTALVECDRWYAENVERQPQTT